jgi:hypothetical protein
MGASNIRSVGLAGSQVIIDGEISGTPGDLVELLHVWLAQPELSGRPGAGLAIDCLGGTPAPIPGGGTYSFTLEAKTGEPGVVGEFVDGPATVSAIAVVVDPTTHAVTQVLQWSRLAMLPEPVVVTASAENQAAQTS